MNKFELLLDETRLEEIMSHYTSVYIIKNISFKKSMTLAYKFLYNEKWDENLQGFSVKILLALKDSYPDEWNSDWRYYAFLGQACDITLRYDERYDAYKHSVDISINPPPELLIKLARCFYSPGPPPISYEKSVELLEKSFKIHPSREAATLLKSIHASEKNLEYEKYWSKMLEKTTEENLPSLLPSFLIK